MTHPEYEQAKKKGEVEAFLADLGIEDDSAPHSLDQSAYALEDFIPVLVQLLMPRPHLTTAPTFTPKTFVDAIQLYDDGAARRLYLYVNDTWRYCTLT
jgi:hypothetical protein